MNRSRGIPIRRRLCFSLLFAALISVPEGSAWADEQKLAALEDVSLKDLMQMEVSSVSRKSQTLFDTAAAAFVVSQEDIRRSGATSIPEALRLVPGIDVAQIAAGAWAVTSRGFNGQYANKLLVLLDGRTVFTPLFSGVFWNLQDTMMEDIDRIEVIRGPGAVMWGANAVNGVINIITKKTKDTLGDLVVAGAGNQERGFAAFRRGGQLGDDGSYRVYGKGFSRAATVDSAGQASNDAWQSGQVGFRMDRSISSDHRLTVQGDTYRQTGDTTIYPLTLLPPFNTALQAKNRDRGANLLARWEGSLSSGSEFTLQAYYDTVHFSAPTLSSTLETLDVDFQYRMHPNASNDLMWGAGYRHISSAAGNTIAVAYAPERIAYQNASAFVQDDIALAADKLRLTLGAKLEKTYLGGTQFQPNARILWTPDSRNSVWASVSKASRTPSLLEARATAALGTVASPIGALQLNLVPSSNLAAEKVTTAEVGYRTQWSSRFSSDIAAFSSRYTNLIISALGNLDFSTLILPAVSTNSTQVASTHGLELSADWSVLDWMRLAGSYTYLNMQKADDPGNLGPWQGTSPRNHGSLRSQMDLSKRSKLDLTLRHVGQLTAATQQVPAYTAFDARLAYAPRPGLEFSLAALNLFSPHHLEWRPSTPTPVAPSETPRSVYVKVVWAY